MTEGSPTVLIVDDEPGLVELYATWLSDRYEVRTARDGEEALSRLDPGVDVVLLDRRMPGLHGDDVLAEIRERADDPCVAMVTAVEPDFDVIGMGFDDYLVKPVSRDLLVSTIENLLARGAYDDTLQEYFSLVSKWSLLRAETDRAEREHSEAFAGLQRRIVELRAELDGMITDLAKEDLDTLFRQVVDDGADRDPGATPPPSSRADAREG